MTNPIPTADGKTPPLKFKARGDYSDLIFHKEVEGQTIEVVDIDAMTEEQFRKFCRDTGSEWFQRMNVRI